MYLIAAVSKGYIFVWVEPLLTVVTNTINTNKNCTHR